jgi:hypothetical protein
MSASTPISPPLPDAPYRGIEPFRFTDQQIFAARSEETWTLLSNVTLYRAVLLYGASGTGKSSLINAGFLPEALKENYVPDRLRVQPFAGREIKVERIRLSGNEENASYLRSNFARPEAEESSESIELSLASFKASLERFRLKPHESGSSLFQTPQSERPLLIFDQFEEFITLFEEAQRVGSAAETKLALESVPAAQQDILTTLVDLIQDETLPIKIIFSFREDYLAKLSLLFEFCPELMDQAQRLLPPGIEELPQIIRAPFTNPELRAHFLKTTKSAGSEISESLAQKISAELARRSEGDTANLTELQIVCQRLWQASDAEAMFAKDGIQGLLKSYGTDVFRHFAPELRDPAVVLLSHMITASNTRNIISEEDLLSRTGECDFEPAQCSSALTALSRSQIVRREPRHSIYFYEITSEYLVPWIKERVAERKSAEELRLAEAAQQKLEAERAEAVARFEAEQQRGRLLRRLLAAMILLVIGIFGMGVFAYRQVQRAHAAEEALEAKEDDVQNGQIRDKNEVIKATEMMVSQDKQESLQGIQQIDTLIKEGKVPSELKSVLIATASTNQDEQVRAAAYKVLTQAAQNDQGLTESIVKAAQKSDTLAQNLPPRFYIHYADDRQLGQAQQVAAALKKQGYIVPGIQKKVDKDAKTNQLRYFRENEPGMPNPAEISSLVRKATKIDLRPMYLKGYDSAKMRPGHFEIWFASPGQPVVETEATDGVLSLNIVDAEGHWLGQPNLKIRIAPDGDSFYSAKEYPGTQTAFRLPPGSFELKIDLEGYETDERKFTIRAEGERLKIRLAKKPGTRRDLIPKPYPARPPNQ